MFALLQFSQQSLCHYTVTVQESKWHRYMVWKKFTLGPRYWNLPAVFGEYWNISIPYSISLGNASDIEAHNARRQKVLSIVQYLGISI